jgi:hypothetical protein
VSLSIESSVLPFLETTVRKTLFFPWPHLETLSFADLPLLLVGNFFFLLTRVEEIFFPVAPLDFFAAGGDAPLLFFSAGSSSSVSLF